MKNTEKEFFADLISSNPKLLREQTNHLDLEAEIIPRESMTSTMMVGAALALACQSLMEIIGENLIARGDDPDAYFINNYFMPIWENPESDGDTAEREFLDDIDRDPEGAAKRALFHEVVIAVSFAVQALRAEENSNIAWSYTVSAAHYAGILRAAPFGKKMRSAASMAMANVRHASTYVERDKIEAYWRENIDPKLSAQKAASKIELAGITEFSHKKIAEIVSALRKK